MNKGPEEQASRMIKFIGETGERFSHDLVNGFVKPQLSLN